MGMLANLFRPVSLREGFPPLKRLRPGFSGRLSRSQSRHGSKIETFSVYLKPEKFVLTVYLQPDSHSLIVHEWLVEAAFSIMDSALRADEVSEMLLKNRQVDTFLSASRSIMEKHRKVYRKISKCF
jgi:hypothetical protein